MCYSIFTVFINNVTESASRINDYFYSILFLPSLLIYVTRKVISIMLRGIQDQTNLQNPPINPDPNVPSTIQGHTHAIHCLSSFNTSHKWCIKLIGKCAMSFEDYILHTCWRQAHGRVWGGWLCNGKIFSKYSPYLPTLTSSSSHTLTLTVALMISFLFQHIRQTPSAI